jgi:hypothetical protein
MMRDLERKWAKVLEGVSDDGAEHARREGNAEDARLFRRRAEQHRRRAADLDATNLTAPSFERAGNEPPTRVDC